MDRRGTPQHRLRDGRSHWLAQFAGAPDENTLAALASRGATVLSYVPEFALSVAADDDVRWAGLGLRWVGRLQAPEKISPMLRGTTAADNARSVIVEFYSDVDPSDARSIVSQSGLIIHDNPDMLRHHLLVSGSDEQVRDLAGWDEVAYIFPASKGLRRGDPLHACAGALTTFGSLGQSVALIDAGWDGPGLGSADLNYVFGQISARLPADQAKAEIARALAEWSKYVKVSFSPGSDLKANRTLAILFAISQHGDGYPFDGRGGVVAHTFYPVPTNPEPIAADMHFDADEIWQLGADVDVYSIALHEAGHALGLGHSDDPNAVMYPYYRMHSALTEEDIAAIRKLYAAREDTPEPGDPSPAPAPAPTPEPAPPTVPEVPFQLAILAPPVTTTASSISLSGTVAGGSGTISVNWSTNYGFAGIAAGTSAWTISGIPLSIGANVITVTAQDSAGHRATQVLTVTRQQVAAPAPNPPQPMPPTGGDTTPPSLAITKPASTTYSTSASSIVVSGTASDNIGVARVTWSSSTGGSGQANGTTNWSTSPIQIYVGTTTIVVRAWDAAGNTRWRSLVVTRR